MWFYFFESAGSETPQIRTIFSKKLFVYQKEGNNNHFFQFFQVDSSAQTFLQFRISKKIFNFEIEKYEKHT